jgi:hypothetical protein
MEFPVLASSCPIGCCFLFSPLIGGVVSVDLVDGFILEEAGEVVEDREEDNDEDVEVSVQNTPL